MVRTVLDGRKTQTRRVIKRQPDSDEEHVGWVGAAAVWRADGIPRPLGDSTTNKCPYGVPGDRLWVREAHQAVWFSEDYESGSCDEWGPIVPFPETKEAAGKSLQYRADYKNDVCSTEDRGWPWRPSIHMHRWASRITLEVTGVRVERVQDITREDAAAEGVVLSPDTLFPTCNTRDKQREQFPRLWNSINAKRGFGWAVNPWVWVVEFKAVPDA